jgi:hypothetical protein
MLEYLPLLVLAIFLYVKYTDTVGLIIWSSALSIISFMCLITICRIIKDCYDFMWTLMIYVINIVINH